jgi:hypothetical protein
MPGGVAGDFFSEATYGTMCPGVDSASKNEYQDTPGCKVGRCVRLTTYHLHVPNVKKLRGLNLPDPHGPVQAYSGTAFLPAPLVRPRCHNRPLCSLVITPTATLIFHVVTINRMLSAALPSHPLVILTRTPFQRCLTGQHPTGSTHQFRRMGLGI